MQVLVIFVMLTSVVCGNTVDRRVNVLVPPVWDEPIGLGTWVCDHKSPKQGTDPEFFINMNYQATGPVTFLVRENYRCLALPQDVAISDLSVYNASTYRSYRSYRSKEMTLCYQFRSRSTANVTLYLNYTLDLCCNYGCPVNENAAAAPSFVNTSILAMIIMILYL